MKKKDMKKRIEYLEVRVSILEDAVHTLSNKHTWSIPWDAPMFDSDSDQGHGSITVTNSDLKVRSE